MAYINQNGKLVQVTQAQYDSYTTGLANDLNLVVPAGGTQLVNNTATTPILTQTNTTNNSPGQTLTTTSAKVVSADTQRLIDSGLYDPGIGFNANGTPKTSTTTTVSADTQRLIDSGLYDPGIGFNANGTPKTSATPVDPAKTLSAGETIVPASETIVPASETNTSAKAVTPGPGTTGVAYDDEGNLLPGYQLNENNDPVFVGNASTTTVFNPDGTMTTDLSGIQGLVKNAQNQQTIADQRKQVNNGDWRVRLRLAPQADYLYNAADPGILAPLSTAAGTDGVLFPYTPSISTSYRAQYTTYDLTHSNYRGYFYQNSFVDAINVNAKFTAQDTNEANYLLAVIHFFRSVTKMFYGQDAQRGSPPPVCYLSGFGDYQFKEAPCLIQQFNYTLPPDVDYIRAGSPNNVGLNLTSVRTRQDVATNSIFSQVNRLANAFLPKGGITNQPAPPTLGLNKPTYVPTMMDISLTLLPIQSRQQVSKQFSLKEFSSGKLIQKGFW